MNEKFFNITLAVVVSTLIGFLIFSGSIDKNSVLGMLGAVGFNLVLFLSTAFGLQYFQLTQDRDIQQEIFDENNIAAAIYQGFLFLGIAIVIAKGVM
jgi:uncharacterized membrane protein YjfL (UPF0719 family)